MKNGIKSFIVAFSWLLAFGTLAAQDNFTGFPPIDPAIRMGKLENGLTYFIRKNNEPEKRASFYIIQNVGAILENDEQDGLAHFLEHMAFNGTANFPGKAIINGLEKHGIGFGSDINAYTGFDETVYNISDVPVDVPKLVDTCLLILRDWSDNITLSNKEIDLERGVISEEWRTSKTASRRLVFETIPVILQGSKYATRDIIGDIEVIKNFSPESLRSYYRKWYRPDLQAIAVVGDIDIDEVEAKIKTIFSGIKKPDNPSPRIYETVLEHKDTYFVLAQDREAPQTTISVITLHKAVAAEHKNLNYVRQLHVISLMNSMINARISETLQKENPPFTAGSVTFGGYYARGYDAFSISAIARQNEEDNALEAIYSEALRAKKYGFAKGELDRAKARMLSSYENMFKQKDKIDNDIYCETIQDYFLTGEPLTSIDFDYEFLKTTIGSITAEEVSAAFREAMIDENRTIAIMGVEGSGIKHLSKEEAFAIIERVESSQFEPYEDIAAGESLLTEELQGSKIIKTVELPAFDAVEWTLTNNAKVIFRKADYEKDNILLSAFSHGGISKLDDNSTLAASMFSSVIGMYGAGEYDNISLQKMMSGKRAAVSFSLDEISESISGSSTPADFETMMQLLYIKFAKPRFDQTAHDAIIGRYTALLASMENDPQKIKSDSVSLILTNYSPRTHLLNSETVGGIALDEIKNIFNDRFMGVDEFVFFIVGNIEREEVIPMVEKYIGAVPAAGRKETWVNRNVKQPDGKVIKEIPIELQVPTTTILLSFANNMKYTQKNSIGLDVIEGILDIVFTEKVREEEGGTYGVGVRFSKRKWPEATAEGVITFDCDPARAKELKDIIYRELDIMMTNGPSQVNLDKTVKNMLKNREEAKLHNNYWLTALMRYYNYGINIDAPANFENILNGYTPKDIRKIAGKMLKKADIADIQFDPK